MTQLTPAVSAHDHAHGDADAPVTLVEYGDFECSYCGQAFTIVQQLQREMGDQLRFVFRNFPLRDIHPHALAAADFAEEAALQSEFWMAHDWLFTHQNTLDRDDLRGAAHSLGLDAHDMTRDEYKARDHVEADVQSGQESGVEGTPTFFINGELWDGSWDFATLHAAVQDAAKSSVVVAR